jgi:predicted nucleic acid-binding protein
VIVVDASVCVPMMIAGTIPDSVRRRQPVGPPILWSETVSALRRMVWRGDLAGPDARAAVERLKLADIDRRLPPELYADATRVATELGWGRTYDAEYVALAHLLDIPLLTRDERLRRGASRLIQILRPLDL